MVNSNLTKLIVNKKKVDTNGQHAKAHQFIDLEN